MRSAFLIVGILTAIRLVLLFFYDTDLGADEGQYWFWAQSFDWGYYSKPPMIAWTIGLSTALFGDHVWSVRVLSPLLIAGAGWFVFLTARRLYGDAPALFSLTLWMTIPATVFGASIYTTDVPMLFFWSMALFALVKLVQGPVEQKPRQAVWLGLALGLGLLSKYAMIYFPLGVIVGMAVSPYLRRGLTASSVAIALGVAGIVFAPNIVWNFTHGLQTLEHTADNANWSGPLLNPVQLLEFFAAQFGVAGPIVFGGFLWGLIRLRTVLDRAGPREGRDLMLLSFALPPLIIILFQALLSRAHANWAMAAYPAVMILLPVWMMRLSARWTLWSSLVVHGALGLFIAGILVDFGLADRAGLSNTVKRLRGWPEQAAQLAERARDYDVLLLDDREVAGHMVWEFRDSDVRIEMKDLNARIDNTFEVAMPFSEDPSLRYLIATTRPEYACAYRIFDTLEPAGEVFVDVNAQRHGDPAWTLHLFSGADHVGIRGPLCP